MSHVLVPIMGNISLAVPPPVVASSELYPQDNAASIDTEVNATTGWTDVNVTGFASSATAPQSGTYALYGVFNGAGSANVSFDLDTILTVSTAYTLDFWIRHSGAGDGSTIRVSLGPTVSGNDGVNTDTILNTETTYQNISWSFTHSADTRYFNVRENSGTNDGGFHLDSISITAD